MCLRCRRVWLADAKDRERQRIEAVGGFVNGAGRVNGNLNLSRSLGDLKYKQAADAPPAAQMITAEPDVGVFEIDPVRANGREVARELKRGGEGRDRGRRIGPKLSHTVQLKTSSRCFFLVGDGRVYSAGVRRHLGLLQQRRMRRVREETPRPGPHPARGGSIAPLALLEAEIQPPTFFPI